MSEEEKNKLKIQLSQNSLGHHLSDESRCKCSEHNKGKCHNFKSYESYLKSLNSRFKKGHIPYNKGITGVIKQSRETINKRFDTILKHKSYKKLIPEEEYYQKLCSLYSKDDIIRQYKSEKYPFHCDFYIKSQDLYIECNFHWTHGEHPFNKNNEEDIKKLNEWIEKSKTSKYYKNAVYVWTNLDVRKLTTLKNNHLNYQFIY